MIYVPQATCDYKTPNGLDQENKLETMNTSQDIKRMQHLAQGLTMLLKDNLFAALNEHMTLEKLVRWPPSAYMRLVEPIRLAEEAAQ